MPVRLLAIPYSPWSEKARWALDHHGLDYSYEHYRPLTGEPALRWRLRNSQVPASVPILFTDQGPVGDSFQIAQFADRHGDGEPLFHRGMEEEIDRWNRISEMALTSGRALHLDRMVRDPASLLESLPDLVPGPMRRSLLPVAKIGVGYIRRKYQIDRALPNHRQMLTEALHQLRSALDDGRDYLLGQLSYADLAMATALHPVEPVHDDKVELGPASRRAWTDVELASELPELLAWRDQLYRRHRRNRISAS